jgi:hypothetical protein
VKQRLGNILIALDQLVWVLLTLGAGSPDETVSAAAWRSEKQGKLFGQLARPLLDALFFFDKQHCYNSYLSEVQGKHLPYNYLEERKNGND